MSKKSAAVMIILTPIEDQLHILFTHRTNSVRTHKDQVSLPGGLSETNDRNLKQTAIRETNEEIGLRIAENEIIGSLNYVDSISNFRIQPFISYKRKTNELLVNKSEVRNVFFIPMEWIFDGSHWQYKKIRTSDGQERNVIFFETYNSETVWGITAQIMVNFVELMKW